MAKLCILKIVILNSFLCLAISAQPAELKFNKYRVKDGLSQSFVTSIMQDKVGFMWFGTQDGLNRFDGYNFVVYRHVPGDEKSLSENWVWDIYEDSKGYLWCGTFGGGASRFDRKSETFKSFRNDPADSTSISDNTIWCFHETANGDLWIGANNGLNLFNEERETFTFFPPPGKLTNVFEIFPSDINNLIIKTAGGMFNFSLITKKFELLPIELKKLNFIDQDSSGSFWLEEVSQNIIPFEIPKPVTKSYTYNLNKNNIRVSHTSSLQVILSPQGFIWGATKNGLSILKYSGNKLLSRTNYYHDKIDPQSLSSNKLSTIYQSRGGEIWISARDALNKFDYNNQKFRHYFNSQNNPNSLSHNGVLPIFASKINQGIVWIGTRNGLNKFDENRAKFTHYFSDPENSRNSLAGNYILSIHEDESGNLWVGTRGNGLSKLTFKQSGKPAFKNFKHDPSDSTSLSSNNVHSIYEDTKGNLWVGTGGGGLCLLNSDSKSFTRFIPSENVPNGVSGNWIYNIVEDRRGKLWLGTAAYGLNLFDPAEKTFKHFRHDPSDKKSLGNNRVLSILETRTGDIWIGTALGLNKLSEPQNSYEDYSFIKYYEKDGLPNDVIYGMLEDDAGNIWISTNNGLSKLTEANGEVSFRNYYTEDGLQSNEFDQNSFSKSNDGKMYFGGINGFNVYHPDSIKDNPFVPTIVITDFKIMNESVLIGNNDENENHQNGGSDYRLRKSITETDTIILSYRDDVISFEFAALNFTVPKRNRYAYMMEGFDADWIYSGSRRFVTYTNLDAGEYIFKVKGSNNDGIWNETGASIFIIVTPPPWASWWAYTIYVLLILYGIFLLIRKREKALKRELEVQLKIDQAKAEERENVRNKTSQDFHDEAGNKLTKIRLFTTLAKRESGADESLKKYLSEIEENTAELSNGMRDFLWVLDAGKDTLFDMIKRLKEFGNSMFEYSETNFKVMGEHNEFKKINLPMEARRTLILIFKEAINNCLKYSKAKNVTLQIEFENNILSLTLSDDGEGFNSEKDSEGYGIKNMKSRAESVKGKLDVISEVDEGTKIIFKGNITQMGN
ncbi:MAG: hypothetical protein HND52_13355 [Ignavibacteriae bacterium]|nr:hypothetical protein [Ignavibacteriota bacterium]NOG98940.1 hypothetical protein [Ignavibacteriota bacterium]